MRQLLLLSDYFAETKDRLIVVLVAAHKGVDIVECEKESAEKTNEFGEVFVEVVFWRRIGGVGHGLLDYIWE